MAEPEVRFMHMHAHRLSRGGSLEAHVAPAASLGQKESCCLPLGALQIAAYCRPRRPGGAATYSELLSASL